MNEPPDWTIWERLYVILACEAFLIFSVTLMLEENDPWAGTHSKPVRTISWLVISLLIVGPIVSLVYGGHPHSSWPSLTIIWISDWRNWAFICLGLACAAGSLYVTIRIRRIISNSVNVMEVLTRFMVACVEDKRKFGAIYCLGSTILIAGVIIVWVRGLHQFSPILLLAVALVIMVALSFLFCTYESAISSFQPIWDSKKNDALKLWYESVGKKRSKGEISERRYQRAEMSFQLCETYLKLPGSDAVTASLLTLVALVDIVGTLFVLNLVSAENPYSKELLTAVMVTIPIVIICDFFGVALGRKIPALILRKFAILIWIFHFPTSIVVGKIATVTTFLAKRANRTLRKRALRK